MPAIVAADLWSAHEADILSAGRKRRSRKCVDPSGPPGEPSRDGQRRCNKATSPDDASSRNDARSLKQQTRPRIHDHFRGAGCPTHAQTRGPRPRRRSRCSPTPKSAGDQFTLGYNWFTAGINWFISRYN